MDTDKEIIDEGKTITLSGEDENRIERLSHLFGALVVGHKKVTFASDGKLEDLLAYEVLDQASAFGAHVLSAAPNATSSLEGAPSVDDVHRLLDAGLTVVVNADNLAKLKGLGVDEARMTVTQLDGKPTSEWGFALSAKEVGST